MKEIKCSFCGDDKYEEGIDQDDVHACRKCCESMGMGKQSEPTEWEKEFDKELDNQIGVDTE